MMTLVCSASSSSHTRKNRVERKMMRCGERRKRNDHEIRISIANALSFELNNNFRFNEITECVMGFAFGWGRSLLL